MDLGDELEAEELEALIQEVTAGVNLHARRLLHCGKLARRVARRRTHTLHPPTFHQRKLILDLYPFGSY